MESLTPASQTSTRIHGLDAVRGGALLLGVLLHASMSFLPGPQIWVVADVQRSTALSVAFFAIHAMRMTVFFLIAGFFGRMMIEQKGAAAFLADRARRIGIPLVIAWPIVFTAVVMVAALAAGELELPSVPRLSPASFPLLHLWFLYVLLILYAAAVTVRAVLVRMDRHDRLRRLVDSAVRALLGPWAAAFLAAPVALGLYLHPYWLMWFGVPTPDASLYPSRAALVTYGLAFGLGWVVQRQADSILPRWTRDWPWHLSLGVGGTAVCLMLTSLEPLLVPVPQGMRKLGFAFSYAVALWGLTLASVGLGLRFLGRYSPRRRYLADASYWIYLAHLPLIMALQWMVAEWILPWPIKLLVILAAAMGLLLLSYRFLVRPTFVGAALNGRSIPPAARRSLPSRGVSAMRVLLLLLLLLSPGALAAQSPTRPSALSLDTVLERYAQAIGPVETIQTRRSTMRVSGLTPFEIPVVVEAMRPDRIRKEVSIQGSVQITAYDGKDAWQIDPFVPGGDRPMDVPGTELPDLLEEADFDGPLVDPATKGIRVTYLGPGSITIGSRHTPVHSLAVRLRDGRESVIHLHATSFLVVQRVQTRPVMGRDTKITITPHAYRTLGGIAIPHVIEIAPEGLPTPVRIVMDRVELNVPVDRQRFSRGSAN